MENFLPRLGWNFVGDLQVISNERILIIRRSNSPGLFFLFIFHPTKQLMAMMRYAEKQGDGFCVRWLEGGTSFIIDDPDAFTKNVVPHYFKPTKFSSFTRKLYRWGFRQLNRGMGQDDPVIFGNDYFQRNKPELMVHMRSTTAAASRKAEEITQLNSSPRAVAGVKRPAEVGQIELHQQLLLSQLLSKKVNYECQSPFASAQSPLLYQTGATNMQFPPSVSGTSEQSLAKMMLYPGSNFALSSPMFIAHTRPSTSSLLNQYMPGLSSVGSSSLLNTVSPPSQNSVPYYPMLQTTAEIVQAAIQALQNA